MSEQIVGKNKVVTFTYLIMDESGSVQEQSDIPMDYLHGDDSKMFAKVHHAMEGKQVGDIVGISLTPEEGFGERDPELTYSDKIENVPPEYQHIGAEAMFQNDLGESMSMTVVSIENAIVTLDGNHPFAGKTMTFKITVQDIRDATDDEISGNHPAEGLNVSGKLH